jgi:hypothetical protein
LVLARRQFIKFLNKIPNFDKSSYVDTCVEAGRLLVADLYDPKGSAKSVHRDVVWHPVRE